MFIIGLNNFVERPKVLHLNMDAEMLVAEEKVSIKDYSLMDEGAGISRPYIKGNAFPGKFLFVA